VLLRGEVDGEHLTQLQVDIFFLLLQNAGSETTRNLITTGAVALLEHPDQLERLRGDLSLLPIGIEELLRYITPVMQFFRRAEHDTEIAGRPIAAGDRVLMVYSSANRDDEVFDRPDGIDITREPNPHVAFGAGGPHFCLGANLARREITVMFDEIRRRLPNLQITGEPALLESSFINGIKRMPCAWK
jgi:cytochrome P450